MLYYFIVLLYTKTAIHREVEVASSGGRAAWSSQLAVDHDVQQFQNNFFYRQTGINHSFSFFFFFLPLLSVSLTVVYGTRRLLYSKKISFMDIALIFQNKNYSLKMHWLPWGPRLCDFLGIICVFFL